MTAIRTEVRRSAGDRPLRIVHLLPCLYLGGAEQHVLRLIKAMSDKHSFSLIAPDGPGAALFDPEGIRRRPFRRLELDIQTGFSSVRRALAEEAALAPIDIVHVHIESGLLWFARKVLPDVPRIFTAHGIVGNAALKFWLTARAINWWSDLACVVSQYEQGRFERAGADIRKVRLISNGVAPQPATPEGARNLAQRLGIEHGRHVVVGTLARLEPEKGLDLLIRAAAELKDSLPALRIVIAGDGGQQRRLRRLADTLGCGDRVLFPGYLREVGDFLSCLDIYVQPSRTEAFGLGVTEAMASGLPTVVTNVGGLPEQVVDGETGLCVPSGDLRGLVDALKRLASDPDLRQRMGGRGQERHAERFSLEKMESSMRLVYGEATSIRGISRNI